LTRRWPSFPGSAAPCTRRGGCATGGLPRPARLRLAGGDGLAAVRTVHLLLAPDRLPVQPAGPAARGGAAYLSAYTARYRSRETQRRLAAGGPLGPETSVDKILLQTAEQQLYDTVRDLLPGVIELSDSPWRPEFLYSRAATIYGGTAEIQRNIIARRLLDLGKE
jgi:alkylation response protein AidB-like acyl-CoA dehydrogenase